MPVFDGSITTETRVRLDQDSFSPDMGSLVGSGNTEDTLIHGKLNQKVDDAITRLFMSNETIDIVGNQDESILGNRTTNITGMDRETVIAGRQTKIIGMLTENFIAGQMITCIGPFNRTDAAPCTWLCPTSSQINSGDLFEAKWFKGGIYLVRNTNIGVDTAIRGENLQITVHATNMTSLETKVAMVEGFATLTTSKASGLGTFMEGLRNNLTGMTARLRAMDAGVGPEVSPPLEMGTPPFS